MSRSRDVSTSALLRLLATGDPEQRCGAALVLGALTPRDRRVIPALGRALEDAPSAVRPYILDAMGRFDDSRTFRYIAPLLFVEGSLREQAVRALEGRGASVLEDLIRFHKKIDRTDTSAFFRVLARISDERAVEYIAEVLKASPFEQARNIAHAVKRAGPHHPFRVRKHIVRTLITALDDLATTGDNPTAEIAITKILAVINDPRTIRPLLERTVPGVLPALRLNALEALAETAVPAARVPRVTLTLLPLLDDTEQPLVVAAALRVLRRFDPFPLSQEELQALVQSRHPDVARVALRELVRFPGAASTQLLLDALRRDESSVQATAATTLARMTESVDAVVDAHEDPRFKRHQETLRTVLTTQAEDLDAAAFRNRVKKLIDEPVDEPVLLGRLLALAAINRAGLNRAVETRAKKALGADEPTRAVTLLEPLVKNRLATPQGRYLLALAHLAIGSDDLTPGAAHHDRAMQLLGPLARVPAFRLKSVLRGDPRLTSTGLHAIIDHMSQRPEAERDVAAALEERLRPSR